MSTRRLYFLDAYNAGDPSFLGTLGRFLLARNEGAIILLDPTDRLLLSLEGAGAGAGHPISEDDVFRLANGPQQREMALRVLTEFTRSVTAALTELQVPAVSLQGSDRGLLRRTGSDGALDASRGGWLFDLVAQGVVPVLSPVSRQSKVEVIHVDDPLNTLEAIWLLDDNRPMEIVLFSDGQRAQSSAVDRAKARLDAMQNRPNLVLLDPAALRRVDTRETAGM